MEYVLTTDHLCKRYRGCKALDHFSMHVPKGAIYGFVGKNGAGKTTLIRLICGLQMPLSGGYSIYGIQNGSREIVKSRQRMGAVVEAPSVYMGMTAADNLRMQYRILGLPSFEGISELLELVGLNPADRKKVKNFSLGMRQRLGIAVALAGDPDFLVLDEPVNGLDPQGIIDMRELIMKLNRERQMTVLISSHILGELSRLATHYGFIDKGKMVQEISGEELEQVCRKCMRIEASDMGCLTCVLDTFGVAYKVINETQADIYDKISITQVVSALEKENCEIFSITEREEDLESYYINLIGGKADE